MSIPTRPHPKLSAALPPPPAGTHYYQLDPLPLRPGTGYNYFIAACATCDRANSCLAAPHEPLVRLLQKIQYQQYNGLYYCKHCWGRRR